MIANGTNPEGRRLYEIFAASGFSGLSGEQPEILANYLEQRACETGLAAPLFLTEMIRSVYRLFRDHDEHGGTQVDFVNKLDRLIVTSLHEIDTPPAPRSATLARELRDKISAMVQGYGPTANYSDSV